MEAQSKLPFVRSWEGIISAALVGLGIAAAGYFASGRYEGIEVEVGVSTQEIFVLDRLTGTVQICRENSYGAECNNVKHTEALLTAEEVDAVEKAAQAAAATK